LRLLLGSTNPPKPIQTTKHSQIFLLFSPCIFYNSQITHPTKCIGCEVNVVYEPPDDDLVEAETCVGVEE
jgi:hypothetical protein